MDLFSTELMAFFPWFHFFSMDNWFLAMDFIFYAVENGLNKFSEPKKKNNFVNFWNGKGLSFILVPESIEQMTLNFFQKSVNECLEILIIIIVIKYRPSIQLHLCTQW